jgi:hypothetical protein
MSEDDKTIKSSPDCKINEYVCPGCGADIEQLFIKWLNNLSGVQNCDLKEFRWKLKIAETTLSMVGIRVGEDEISEKLLQRMQSIVDKKMTENERQRYEDEIEMLRKLMEEKLTHKDETIRQLERSKRELADKEIQKLNERILHLEELKREKDKGFEKLEKEYGELSAKLRHNPSAIGYGAEVALKEDLDANFSMQRFEDIAQTEKHGDLLVDFRTELESGWVNTGMRVVIDSKDKDKVTKSDIDKLCSDMEYWNAGIGLIIAADESQLRLMDKPCSLIPVEKGLIIITSKSDRNHHLVLKLLEIFAREKYIQKISTVTFKQLIQNKSLYNKISALFEYKAYIQKIEDYIGKTENTVKELDGFLEPKLGEISRMILSLSQEEQEQPSLVML